MFPEDLSTFTVAGITELRNAAAAQLATLRAAIESPESATDEQVAEMEGLFNYVTKADAEIAARNERASKIASFTVTETTPEAEVTPTEAVETEVKDATEVVQASAPATTEVVSAEVGQGGEGVRRSVQIADVAGTSNTDPTDFREEAAYTIRAAADVPGFVTGKELDWSELGKAFEARARGYGNSRPTNGKGSRAQHGFALIEREFPEAQQLLDNDGDMGLYNKLTEVQKNANKVASDTNALVAAAGWCAPSETIYSTVNPVTADGLLDLPEVVARRGGIRHNQGINWVTFFGGSAFPAIDVNPTGMTLLTEAQVIADNAKTCLEIDCPPFIDERLNVAALCLTGSLLQNRGYPEYVAEFTRGAMASFQHLVNREVIDILEDGSTGVNLSTVDPWVSDATVVSNVMSAVEHAVVDMRYRLRLSLTAPIDFVFPEWIRAQMRADWIRRNAAQTPDLADAEIAAMFARRGARVQYVYDWQDAFSGGITGGTATYAGYGALTAPTGVPAAVRFLAFPPGTWILARQDVIRLDTVYDSVNLQLNQVTQLFMEDGYLPMRMGPLSRVYTLNIGPVGSTGAQRAVTMTDVTP